MKSKDTTINELRKLRSNLQGPRGYTPIKGLDYFTVEEVQAIITYVRSQINDGVDGKDGLDGKDGKDGKQGTPGYTPIRGVDYWNNQDKEKLANELESLVRRHMPKVEAIASKVKVESPKVKYADIQDAPDVSDLPKLVDLLKRGGFRGGGDTIAAGSNITISYANGVKTISATGGGGGMVTEIPSGLVNSTNTSYTSNVLPKIIVTDYGTLVDQTLMQVAGISGFTYTGTGPYNISVPIAPNNFIIVYS